MPSPIYIAKLTRSFFVVLIATLTLSLSQVVAENNAENKEEKVIDKANLESEAKKLNEKIARIEKLAEAEKDKMKKAKLLEELIKLYNDVFRIEVKLLKANWNDK